MSTAVLVPDQDLELEEDAIRVLNPLPPRHSMAKLGDLVSLVLLVLFTTGYVLSHVNWRGLPMEDALMLLRYSSHVAQGFGITWNIGEHPVEGATDFLYMAVLGLFSRFTHIGVITAGRVLTTAAHVTSVCMLYVGARRLFRWPVWASLCIALYLAVDLARAYIQTGFSAPFYAVFALAAWYLILKCIVEEPTTRRGIGIGVLLGLVYLIRPEGIFMDGFLLSALLFARRTRALRTILTASAVLCLIAVPYFFWRWHYFGYPFPNPLYLKGGGHLHWDSLMFSFRASWIMLAPVIPIYLSELVSANWRRAVTALIPTAGFACIWVLLSNENNHFMRFQYCGVPLALLAAPYASATIRERFRGLRVRPVAQVVLIAIALWFSLQYWGALIRIAPSDLGLYNIAVGMHQYKAKDYVVATTEAGLIPYFSEWRSIDLYGLNDPEIVHNPHGLTNGYLEQRNPAVILNHFLPRHDLVGPLKQAVEETRSFAETHNYELAAVWGYNACDRHYWYVRRDIPEAGELIALMQKFPYMISGTTMVDLRNVPTPDSCMYDGVELSFAQ